MSRHKHYTPPVAQPQITFANVLDKLEAAVPEFTIHALDPVSAAKHFRKYAKEIAAQMEKYEQEPPSVPVDTSEAAALGMYGKTGRIAANVLSFIRARGPRGATLRELAQALRLNENTARPRVWELEGNVPAGRRPRPALIYKSEEKREGMRVYRAITR